mmetsp:Transcript_25001/g.33508  ORF Transcript_25001/g.33508 Transcript_25001/m.33508 type:complete len:85 (+) Transcript_25001:87-341(+)
MAQTSINRGSVVDTDLNLENKPSLSEPLLDKQEEEDDEDDMRNNHGCWYGCKRYFNWTISLEKRKLFVDGTTQPGHFCSNRLNN